VGFGLLQRSGLPDPTSSLELFYRHAVLPEDNFQMLPGFKNFDPVKQGQQLGVDKSGPVYSPDDGRVFLPLYQPEGEDGFFLVRDIPDLNFN
jgi:succinylglutamate desuccinylase